MQTQAQHFYDSFPEQIGEYTKWDCPNDNTIVYRRDYHAVDGEEFPKLREKFSITTQDVDGFNVTRSVVLRERTGAGTYVTHSGGESVVDDLQAHHRIGVGFDTAQRAFEFLEQRVDAASRSDQMPMDVTRSKNPIHQHFRDLRLADT